MTITELVKIFWSIIAPDNKKRLFFVVFMQCVAAVVENVMAVSIASFASFSVNPQAFLENKKIIILLSHIPFVEAKVIDIMLFLVAAMVVSVALKAVFSLSSEYMQSTLAEKISNDTAMATMKSLMARSFSWHLKQNPADLVLALQWRQFGSGLCSTITQIVFNIMLALLLLSTLCFADPVLVIPMLIISCMGGAVYKVFRGRVSSTSKLYFYICLVINAIVSRGIYGVREVKVFQAENYLEKELSEQLDKGAPYRALQKFYAVCPTNALEFLVIMTVGGFGAYLIIWSGMSQGAAVAMLSLLAVSGWRMVPAANKIITGFKTLEQSWPYLEKLATYISGGHREVYEDGEQAELCFDNDIRVDNLAFSYDVESLPVLSDVSFDIRKAQTTAIIGDSGAGKSTMLYLLLGLLDPTGGNILLGDRRLDATTRGAWLKRVGYVPQSPYVQTGTLAENIAFGVPKPEISIDRVMECCKLAAIDFIDELANGLDTVVGDGGVRLSGGQCQRVAIARALYRDPCVLIFDEATSALDTHNEQAVMGALMSLRGKMTMVLVTHRLDSAFACDRVVYLRKGEAVVVGAPDEIIPLYKERQVCDVGFSECR